MGQYHNEGIVTADEEFDHGKPLPPVSEKFQHSKRRKLLTKCLAFLFSHIGLTLLVVFYMIGGALMFEAIESGKWVANQTTELPPAPEEPNYDNEIPLSVVVWKAPWMSDKVLRFWNHTEMNDKYPSIRQGSMAIWYILPPFIQQENWTSATAADIELIEIYLYKHVIQTIVNKSANYTRLRTRREMAQEYMNKTAPDWTFPSAFLYSLSIVTTIGYGHIAPYTETGKAVTVVYAIVGIPILLAFLANIGDLLARFFRILFDHLVLMKVCRKVYRKRAQSLASSAANSPTPVRSGKFSLPGNGNSPVAVSPHRPRPSASGGTSSPALGRKPPLPPKMAHSPLPSPRLQQYRDYQPTIVVHDGINKADVRSASLQPYEYTEAEMELIEDAQKAEKSVPVLMCVAIMAIYLVLGAIWFGAWEGWEPISAFYFCFITLSTIGLGDMWPGQSMVEMQGGKVRLMCCSLYILVGLALLASCFNLIHDSARSSIKAVGEKLGIVKQKPRSRRQSTATII